MRISRKRLLISAGGITGVAAVGTLLLGATFGFFSSTPASETNSFTAGTVTLSSDATGKCTVTNIAPGDSGTCTFAATYSGSLPAYLALNVAVGAGTTPLYDSSVNGLQFNVTDSQTSSVSYMNGTTLNGAATSGNSPSASNLLVNKNSFSSGTITWTVAWSLPTSAGNAYQAGSSTLTLTAHAVQSAHNGSTTTCTAGLECDSTSPGTGTPAWS
jgi:hypothetical protein